MSEWTFWLIVAAVGVFLWWLAYVATARMRVGNNLEREEQARRNLERLARQEAEALQSDNPTASKQEEVEASKQEQG